MCGHIEMDDAAALVGQNQAYVQNLEAEGRHCKEVHGHHGLDVILKECVPGLRWRLPAPDHVLAHTGFADINAQFQQFAMDPRCTPQRILPTHLADQLAGLGWYRRSSALSPPNLPGPEQP